MKTFTTDGQTLYDVFRYIHKNSPLDDEKIMEISGQIRMYLRNSELNLENMVFEIKMINYGGIYLKEDE